MFWQLEFISLLKEALTSPKTQTIRLVYYQFDFIFWLQLLKPGQKVQIFESLHLLFSKEVCLCRIR